jgi:hypothetical protein
MDSGDIATTVGASDGGSGIREMKLFEPAATQTQSFGCAGTASSPCQAGQSYPFTYNTAVLPEGANGFSTRAYDAVGNASASSGWTVGVDHTAPALSLSGVLKDRAGQRLSDGDGYGLHVAATDGDTASPSTARAGVKSIEIQVDGARADLVSQPCDAGSCSLARDWTFHPERYAAGEHTIAVVARDQLGHAATDSFKVKVAHAASAQVGMGQVNLLTGNLNLSEDDVDVASFGADLTLSRAYNSRDPSAGADGPFGPGWVSSVPVDES